jgi:DNA-binding XRE family transcriptional regulator
LAIAIHANHELSTMPRDNQNIQRYPRIPRYKLIKAREMKGLTQEELADQIDLSRYTVLSIEVGLRDPSLQTMLKWTKALDIRPRGGDRLDLFDTERAA